MPTLNIIGAGKLGSTLAHLWHQHRAFRIGGICNRSLASSTKAVKFIGAGTACSNLDALPDADCWLIATQDRSIEAIAKPLAQRLANAKNAATIFHCSGALAADILQECKTHSGVSIGSAHPAHSFADPRIAIGSLAHSTVALEGDPPALAVLRRAFSALNCQLIVLNSEQKVLYHAGSVFACNYLTTLIDLSLQSFAAAGIDETTARKLLQPLIAQTVHNNLNFGPANALTGPIARGDSDTVAKQLISLSAQSPLLESCYRTLGLASVQLAQRNGLTAAKSQRLIALLNEQHL